MWNDEIGLAKADALSVFADHIERTYGENGECSATMHQRTIDVILDIAREHASDLEDMATNTNLDDAGVLQNAKLYYGDDDVPDVDIVHDDDHGLV